MQDVDIRSCARRSPPARAVERVAEARERIACANRVDFGGVAQVIAFAVRTKPRRADDEEAGFARVADGAHDPFSRPEKSGWLSSSPHAEAERLAARRDGSADRLGGRRRLRDPVVFDHEEHRDAYAPTARLRLS